MSEIVEDPLAPIAARHMQYTRVLLNQTCKRTALESRIAKFEGWQPRQWQQIVIDLAKEEPNGRRVYWIWDVVGGKGKSVMADYLACFHQAAIFTHGKLDDIAHAYNYERVVIFDLSRTQADKIDHIYMCIEHFKDGRMFSPKYDSTLKQFDVPHVFVFANFEPDTSKLSADRWLITELK